MIRLPFVLFFSALLFSAGVYGVLARRNAIMVLMAIELMLNAVNVNLVGAAPESIHQTHAAHLARHASRWPGVWRRIAGCSAWGWCSCRVSFGWRCGCRRGCSRWIGRKLLKRLACLAQHLHQAVRRCVA